MRQGYCFWKQNVLFCGYLTIKVATKATFLLKFSEIYCQSTFNLLLCLQQAVSVLQYGFCVHISGTEIQVTLLLHGFVH